MGYTRTTGSSPEFRIRAFLCVGYRGSWAGISEDFRLPGAPGQLRSPIHASTQDWHLQHISMNLFFNRNRAQLIYSP